MNEMDRPAADERTVLWNVCAPTCCMTERLNVLQTVTGDLSTPVGAPHKELTLYCTVTHHHTRVL